MANTITNFYSFTAGTKARASEMNTNFDNFRGDIIPINTDTASASDMTHNLGGSTHRWNVGYFGSANFKGATTTSEFIIQNQTGVTAGAAEFLINTTTLSNFGFGEFGFQGNTTTNYTKFQFQSGVTAGAIDLLMGSTTIGGWTTNGHHRKHIAPLQYTSSSAPAGTAIIIGSTSFSCRIDTTGSYTIASMRLTVKGSGVIAVDLINGRPAVEVGIGSNVYLFYYNVYYGTTTTAMTLASEFTNYPQIASFSTPRITVPISPSTICITNYSAGEIVVEARYRGGGVSNTTGSTAHYTGSIMVREL